METSTKFKLCGILYESFKEVKLLLKCYPNSFGARVYLGLVDITFFYPVSMKHTAATLTVTCAWLSDLYLYAVFVCSIGIISVLLFTLVILCQSLLNKRRSTGEWNVIFLTARPLPKRERGRRRMQKMQGRQISPCLDFNKNKKNYWWKRLFLPAKLEQRHFAPFE